VTAAERFRYDYSDGELEELTGPVADLAGRARETDALMYYCYRDYAVRNAAALRDPLAGLAGG
jgi:uncharacterized protein YecE (DUF72 family)